MKLYAIGDTHLPSTRKKEMERFGWIGHPKPLADNWDALVKPEDGVIVAGDISWASKPHEVMDDLAWIDARPGKKVLLRGNHDYWWGDSAAKLKKLLEPFPSIVGFLQNSAVVLGPYIIAGSRLWTAPEAPPMPGGEMGNESLDLGLVDREANRLKLSIEAARVQEKKSSTPLRRVVAVHFPPLYVNETPTAFSKVVEAFEPEVCVYGHLHGEAGIAAGFVGVHGGVRYVLASCDAAQFRPILLLQ
jgi:predicted phosphohydrolase